MKITLNSPHGNKSISILSLWNEHDRKFPTPFVFLKDSSKKVILFPLCKKYPPYAIIFQWRDTFCSQNTIGALILTSLSARLHHHPTSHSIKRIRNQPCYCSDSLGNHPAHYNMHILWIRQHTCHQEQGSRVSTERKGCGKDSCGRNNHPPAPGVTLSGQLNQAFNFSLHLYLTSNRYYEWNSLYVCCI